MFEKSRVGPRLGSYPTTSTSSLTSDVTGAQPGLPWQPVPGRAPGTEWPPGGVCAWGMRALKPYTRGMPRITGAGYLLTRTPIRLAVGSAQRNGRSASGEGIRLTTAGAELARMAHTGSNDGPVAA